MSYVNDIKALQDIRDKIPSIPKVYLLQEEVARALDIVNLYNYDLKGIPRELNKWNEYLLNGGIYGDFTDDSELFNNILLGEAKEGTLEAVIGAETGLKNKLEEIDDITKPSLTQYYIGDVNIDYLISPTEENSTDVISQNIVTDQLQDSFNEDLENRNTTVSMTIILEGDDREYKYNKLLEYRLNKQRFKAVLDKVYDSMVFINISKVKSNETNIITVNISMESIYVTSIQRTEEPLKEFETPLKETSSSGKQGSITFDRSFYEEQQQFGLIE